MPTNADVASSSTMPLDTDPRGRDLGGQSANRLLTHRMFPVGTGVRGERCMNTSSRLPPVVVGVDNRYIDALAVLLVSLACNSCVPRGRLRVIVVHHELGTGNIRRLRDLAELLGIDLDLRPVPAGASVCAPVSGWISEAVYLRLSIPEVVADEPVVLYVDCDIIALRDLVPLLRRDLARAPLGAVRDARNPRVGYGLALPGWERLGVERGRDYFNSGVMLLDLHHCRRIGLFERAWAFLAEHPGEVRLWDQDALNVAAGDHWMRLGRNWNTFALSPLVTLPDWVHEDAEPVMPLATLLADESTAALLHYAGPLKPWQEAYPAGPLRDVYRELARCCRELLW